MAKYVDAEYAPTAEEIGALARAMAAIWARSHSSTLEQAVEYRAEKWRRHLYEAEQLLKEGNWLSAHNASIRAAALDEAAVVAEADAAKWEIRWQDSDHEESAVCRMYAAYRDTALALASAIRALKEEKK